MNYIYLEYQYVWQCHVVGIIRLLASSDRMIDMMKTHNFSDFLLYLLIFVTLNSTYLINQAINSIRSFLCCWYSDVLDKYCQVEDQLVLLLALYSYGDFGSEGVGRVLQWRSGVKIKTELCSGLVCISYWDVFWRLMEKVEGRVGVGCGKAVWM